MRKVTNVFRYFSFLIFMIMISCSNSSDLISPSNVKLQYIGRVDRSNPDAYVFAFPGITVRAKFSGKSISAYLVDNGGDSLVSANCFYAVIDGGELVKIKLSHLTSTYELASDLEEGVHTLELTKLTESVVGSVSFLGLQLEDGAELLDPDSLPSLKMEFIGNSMTCGYGNEMSSNPPKEGFTSLNENVYRAWGMIASRTLQAQCVCTSYSGRGLYRNFEGSTVGTLPLIYDRVLPDEEVSKWDHSQYIPDIVVINLGTNDFSAESFSGFEVDSSLFVGTYVSFLEKLRSYYPQTKIICAVGVMTNDFPDNELKQWTRLQRYVSAAKTYMNRKGDKNVFYLMMEPQSEPYGEDWHPTIATHERMANELVSFIKRWQLY